MGNNYDKTLPPQVLNNERLGEMLTGEDENPVNEIEVAAVINKGELTLVTEEEFYDNLVEVIDIENLDDIGMDTLASIEQDIGGRKNKDDLFKKGIQRLGWIPNETTKGGDMEGACKATNPIIAEMVIDFSSKAIHEIYPPKGIVKTHLVGKVDVTEEDEATRKANYVNYLFDDKLNFRQTLESLFTQLPLTGSQYLKVLWNHEIDDIEVCFVPWDMIYIPDTTTNFLDAERITQVIKLSKRKWNEALKSGLYTDYHELMRKHLDKSDDLGNYTFTSEPERLRMEINGMSSTSSGGTDYDEVKVLYECHTFLKVKEDELTKGASAPYIVVVDEDSNVVGLYRNWDMADINKKQLETFVQFNYLPWSNAQGIGLIEIMDGMASIGTGAMRALMDAALQQTFPPMVMLKGASIAGQSASVKAGQITYVDAGTGSEGADIRQLITPIQTASPSPVLSELIGYADKKKNSFQTSIEGVADTLSNGDAPVGTALALFEENNKRFGAIYARQHFSMANLLRVMCRVLGKNLNTEVATERMNGQVITRGLFRHAKYISLVSDPSIFSSAQRYAQVNYTLQMAEKFPQYYNIPELLRRQAELIGIPDIDSVLNLPQSSGKLNAVAENISIFTGIPTQVFPPQDHLAHIATHLDFAESPYYGNNPLFANCLMELVNHVNQHLLLLYAQMYNEVLLQHQENPDVLEGAGNAEVDKVIQDNSEPVLTSIEQVLQPYQERMVQIAQKVQQMQQQQQQQNPDAVKAQAEAQKMQLEQQKLQLSQQEAAMKAKQFEAKLQDDKEDRQTQLEIERDRMIDKKMEIQGKLDLERMKAEAERENDEREALIAVLRQHHDSTVAKGNAEDAEIKHVLALIEQLSKNKERADKTEIAYSTANKKETESTNKE